MATEITKPANEEMETVANELPKREENEPMAIEVTKPANEEMGTAANDPPKKDENQTMAIEMAKPTNEEMETANDHPKKKENQIMGPEIIKATNDEMEKVNNIPTEEESEPPPSNVMNDEKMETATNHQTKEESEHPPSNTNTNNDISTTTLPPPTTTPNKKKTMELTDDQRSEVMNFLLIHYHNGKLQNKAINTAASKFDVHRNTVGKIWKKVREKLDVGSTAFDVSSKKKGKCGRKPKNWDAAIEKINSIPLSERSSLRSLSRATQIPKTTLFRLIKDEKIKRVSKRKKSLANSHLHANNPVKESSTENQNKIEIKNPTPELKRLIESLEKLDSDRIKEVQEFVNSKNLSYASEDKTPLEI